MVVILSGYGCAGWETEVNGYFNQNNNTQAIITEGFPLLINLNLEIYCLTLASKLTPSFPTEEISAF